MEASSSSRKGKGHFSQVKKRARGSLSLLRSYCYVRGIALMATTNQVATAFTSPSLSGLIFPFTSGAEVPGGSGGGGNERRGAGLRKVPVRAAGDGAGPGRPHPETTCAGQEG